MDRCNYICKVFPVWAIWGKNTKKQKSAGTNYTDNILTHAVKAVEYMCNVPGTR